MPTKKRTRLGRPDAAAVVDGRYKQEKLRWRKTRLLCVKLAARGEHTSAQIADLCGVSRGRIFEWLKLVRREGLEALLQREKPGPREGTRRGLSDSVERALNKKLRAGQFCSAVQAQRWLEEAHGIKKPYKSVWNWLKKLGGVIRVPRPSHPDKDPAAATLRTTERLGHRARQPGQGVGHG